MANIFSDYTKRNEKKIMDYVDKVNALKGEYESITDDQSMVTIRQYGVEYRVTHEQAAFMARTYLFRKRLRNGESIEDIMPDAIALVREATKRRLGMFHYDVQVEAGIAMLGNKIDGENRENIIAEMKTGEGKTLVQILVGYLNALDATKDEDPTKWKGVHIMTSNDALARRDALSNGKVFGLLGFTSGFVPSRRSVEGKSPAERNIYKHRKQQAYKCDIVFSTATNIAFDYLDDNTVTNKDDINITRPFGYAIVDEADDLLIDQANNPLKISGRPRGLSKEYEDYVNQKEQMKLNAYKWAAEFMFGKKGVREHPLTYKIFNQVNLRGREKEKFFSEYEYIKGVQEEEYAYVKDTQDVIFSRRLLDEISSGVSEEEYQIRISALQDCIKAEHTYSKEKYYELVKSNGKYKVMLVDQNTGRYKHGSKYVDGMQEAIEAVETYKGEIGGYEIEKTKRTDTLAMCTYPDFLSLYEGGVSGMTGTSAREEFRELYGFETYDVRTRKPNIRKDEENEVYATKKQKYKAIIKEIISANKKGQPVLIGTTSVGESKELSDLLKSEGITHRLLNATNEENENEIISHAGEKGSVTIATNMAGRGTDIKINDEVRSLGGLYVIGTTRNKSLRIDSQLRGRAGRQGDPGKTKYFSSLQDELIKLYIDTKTLVKLYKSGDGRINNSKVIKAVNKALRRKDELDKQNRRIFEQLNVVFSRQKNHIYKMRNNILNYDPKKFLDNVRIVISEYATYLVNNCDEEEMKRLVGHLIQVEDCYSPDKKEYAQNIANFIYLRLKSNFDKNNTSTKELARYLNDIKIKFLNVVDVYWQAQMKNLEDIKSNVANNYAVDTLKEYDRLATLSFGNELIPLIYNEMLTYACMPALKFGEYEPKSYASVEDKDKKILV